MSDAAARPRLAAWAFAAALLLCAATAAIYVRPDLLDRDEAIFAASAYRMRALDVSLYTATWEHKPPGVFLAHALAQSFGLHPLTGAHLLNALLWVATAGLLGAFAWRSAAPAAAAPVVLAYTLLRSHGESKAGAANGEAFLQFPLALAILLLLGSGASPRGGRRFTGGVLLGIAVLCKPPIALLGPACVLAVWLRDGGRSALLTALWGGLGAVLPPLVSLLASWRAGDLDGWLIANVIVNRVYVAEAPATAVSDWIAGVTEHFRQVPAPWLLAAAALVAAGRRGGSFLGAPASRTVLAALVLLGASVAAVSVGGSFYDHYWWMATPVLAVLAGLGWHALATAGADFPSLGAAARRALLGLAIAIVVLGWGPSQRIDKRRLLAAFRTPRYDTPEVRSAVEALRLHARPDETVFVWGIMPHLYLEAERAPATRFVSCNYLTGFLRGDARSGSRVIDPDLVPGAWPRLLEDLERWRPRVVLDTTGTNWSDWDRYPVDAFPQLRRHLDAHYSVVPPPRPGADRFVVHVRRD